MFGPYGMGFRLALTREMTYRANFLFGRVREIMVTIGLLYLYLAMPPQVGAYGSGELATFGSVERFAKVSAAVRVSREDVIAVAQRMLAELPIVDLNIQDPSLEDAMRALFRK